VESPSERKLIPAKGVVSGDVNLNIRLAFDADLSKGRRECGCKLLVLASTVDPVRGKPRPPLNALRAVGQSANRRLCDAESAEALLAPDVVTFHQVTRPSNSEDGLYAPALRFGDPRVMAVLASAISSRALVIVSGPRYDCLTRCALHNSTSHLRSAPAQTQGAHPQNASQPSLPAHPAGSQSSGALYQDLRASPGSRSDLTRS
jgi:hypothetical protein